MKLVNLCVPPTPPPLGGGGNQIRSSGCSTTNSYDDVNLPMLWGREGIREPPGLAQKFPLHYVQRLFSGRSPLWLSEAIYQLRMKTEHLPGRRECRYQDEEKTNSLDTRSKPTKDCRGQGTFTRYPAA